MDTERMPRKKQRGEVKRLPIELDLADPEQKRLWDYWQTLSEQGQAAQWARETLIAALPQRNTRTGVRYITKRNMSEPTTDGEPRYEDVDE